MHILGFSLREWLRSGVAAVSFILIFKWVAPKTKVPALTTIAGAV